MENMLPHSASLFVAGADVIALGFSVHVLCALLLLVICMQDIGMRRSDVDLHFYHGPEYP